MPGDKAMRQFKSGTLRSGSKAGPVVRNPKQAIAIMLNEERREGKAVPPKPAKPSIGGALGRNLKRGY